MTYRTALAGWMRKMADRIDHAGAPKLTHWTFTFELYRGMAFREDGKGCRVAYLGGDDEFDKAHTQADAGVRVTMSDIVSGKVPGRCPHHPYAEQQKVGRGKWHCGECGTDLPVQAPPKLRTDWNWGSRVRIPPDFHLDGDPMSLLLPPRLSDP
jgi:hypothetical protein